jgi:para-aminobenzoate synthetase/4-amino-4-deoxychorismate lyase
VPEEYAAKIEQIKRYIESGDTYQVNFTMRLKADFAGDAYALFYRLCRLQQAKHCAFVDLGDTAVCSASPELFFELSGEELRMRPMKGTQRRGGSAPDDELLARKLLNSAKDRAENVMIVDMVRNDLGRIAKRGTVTVERLFEIEQYPTVWQMTSSVLSQSRAGFGDILRALFPCASITGAPKVRTMEIIRELEEDPRGIYTGSIGYWMPGRKARFNVAIRTAVVERVADGAGSITYGVGGGIVWDSVDGLELDECLAKAAVLSESVEDFCLLETLRWQRESGFWLLDRHIERAASSARYFGIDFDAEAMRSGLEEAVSGVEYDDCRVRWLLDAKGAWRIEQFALEEFVGVRRVGLVRGFVRSGDRFLYHKTTQRAVYEKARGACPALDDVILVNERGEVTESSIANVVVDIGGCRVTPPVESGLLAGTMRAELLASGDISEAIVTEDQLLSADKVWLINSVRGWMPVELSASNA